MDYSKEFKIKEAISLSMLQVDDTQVSAEMLENIAKMIDYIREIDDVDETDVIAEVRDNYALLREDVVAQDNANLSLSGREYVVPRTI